MMLSHPVLLGFLWSLLIHSTSGQPQISGQETNKVYAYSYHFTHNGTTNSQDILRNFLGTDPDFGNDPPPGQSIIKTFSSPSIRGFFTKGILPAGPLHHSFGSGYSTNSAIDNIKKVVEANLQPPPQIASRLLPPISPDITNDFPGGFNNVNDIGLNFQQQDDFPKIPPPPPPVPFHNSEPLQNIPSPPASIGMNDFPKIPEPIINNNGISRIENFSRNTPDGGKVEGQIETFAYNPSPISNSRSNYEHLSEGFRRNEKFLNNNQDVTGHRTQSYFRQQFRTIMPNSAPSTLLNHKNRINNNNAVNTNNNNNQWWNVLNVLGGNNNNNKRLDSKIDTNIRNQNLNNNVNKNINTNVNNNVNHNINNNNNNADRIINKNINNRNKELPRQFGSRLSNLNNGQNNAYNNQNVKVNNQNGNLNNQNVNLNNPNLKLNNQNFKPNNQNVNLNNPTVNFNNRNVNFKNQNGNFNNRNVNFNNENANFNNHMPNNIGFRTQSHPNIPLKNRIDSNEGLKPVLNNMLPNLPIQTNNINNQQHNLNNHLTNKQLNNNVLPNFQQSNNAFNNGKNELSNRFNNDDTTKNVLNIINEVNEQLNNLNNNGGGRNNNNNFRLTWDDEVPQLFNRQDWSQRQLGGNGRPFSNAHAGPVSNQVGPKTVNILNSAMEALVEGRPISVPEISDIGPQGGNYRNSGGGGIEKFFALDKVIEGPNSFSRNQHRGFERNFHVNSNSGYQRNNNWSTNAVRRLDALSTKADFSKDFIDVFRDDY